MNNDILKRQLQAVKRRLAESIDEYTLKQVVIQRILSCLGWDIFDDSEVTPEYTTGGKRVDYSLRHGEQNKVFIEVKKPSENLDNHQEQLLRYSFSEGIRMALLTNGVAWWFYLPAQGGTWEERKILALSILEQSDEFVSEHLYKLLSKTSVLNGEAFQFAESIYHDKHRRITIKRTLPLALNRILTTPDELFIELLEETTERICGYRPSKETCLAFVAQHADPHVFACPESSPASATPSRAPTKKPKLGPSSFIINAEYTHQKPSQVIVGESTYAVTKWIDVLITVCELLIQKHPSKYKQVLLSFKGKKRPYFSLNPDELRYPRLLAGTTIHCETNFSAETIGKLTKALFLRFNDSSDFKIIISK